GITEGKTMATEQILDIDRNPLEVGAMYCCVNLMLSAATTARLFATSASLLASTSATSSPMRTPGKKPACTPTNC
ncbi:hypothetical protein Q8G14_26810, partial [Klebsiella variicola]|uniref:hypothetical protein n=1 Tax=Klebsiella variicola TaxID=244366 RepID=UPI00272F530A